MYHHYYCAILFSDAHSIRSVVFWLISLPNPKIIFYLLLTDRQIHRHLRTQSHSKSVEEFGEFFECVCPMCCVIVGNRVLICGWQMGQSFPSQHTKYPPSHTHCFLSMKTATRQILKPDTIINSLGHHTLREMKTE